jgi:hypothetical protein
MLHLIVDCNAHHVTPCRVESRPWRDSIDEEANLLATTSPVTCTIGDVERVIHGIARGRPFL